MTLQTSSFVTWHIFRKTYTIHYSSTTDIYVYIYVNRWVQVVVGIERVTSSTTSAIDQANSQRRDSLNGEKGKQENKCGSTKCRRKQNGGEQISQTAL